MNTTASRWNRSALGLLGAGLIVALTGGVVLTAQAQPMMDGGPRMGMMAGHTCAGRARLKCILNRDVTRPASCSPSSTRAQVFGRDAGEAASRSAK